MSCIKELKKHLRGLGRCAFPVCVFLFLLTMGVCCYCFREIRKIEFENRMSRFFPKWSNALWMDCEWQRKFNEASADQLPFALDAKKKFFWLRNGVLYEAQKRMYNFTDYYVHFRNGIYFYGDEDGPYLLYMLKTLDKEAQEHMQAMAKQINNAASRHQDKAFYVYYIERDIDIRYDTKKRTGIYEFLKDNLSLAQNHIACFKVRDFEEYKRDFNKTDHHWQYIGSYKGYKEVFHLLDLDKEGETLNKPITPNSSYGVSDDCPPKLVEGYKPVLISRLYHDSKCRITGTPDKFYDKFYVYVFDYVPMKIIINGEKGEYGNQGEFLKNKDIALEFNLKYGTFYGGDEGEIIFDTGRKNRPNILIFGDSFDNAILKLIAGHFNKTYSIDLRHYKDCLGKPFSIDEYMKTHKIDKVLFIGNQGFFEQKEFRNF